jgi:hypothetical protein
MASLSAGRSLGWIGEVSERSDDSRDVDGFAVAPIERKVASMSARFEDRAFRESAKPSARCFGGGVRLQCLI